MTHRKLMMGGSVILIIAMALIMMALTQTTERLRVIGDEDLILSSTSSASGFATIPNMAESMLIAIQGDSIRWKAFNTDPESNNGGILDEGDYYLIDTPYEIQKWKGILKSGGSAATAHGIYYGRQ